MPLFTITQKLKYISLSQQKVSILAVLWNCWKKKSDFQRKQFKGDLLPPLPTQADCAANRLWHFAKHISMASSTPHFFVFNLASFGSTDGWCCLALCNPESWEKLLQSAAAANTRGCDSEEHNKAGLHWLQCGLALNNVWNNNVWARQQTTDHLCYKT